MIASILATNLTQRPPRVLRQRLGGYAILPRMLDKGRATLAKTNGEYNYDSTTDRRFLGFVGIDAEALLRELEAGKGDGEILEWINAPARTPRQPWENEASSATMDHRGPDSDAEPLAGFAEYVGQHSTTREDIRSWFDAIELDDYASFGGKP